MFHPNAGYVEVEPITAKGIIGDPASEKFVEKARVIGLPVDLQWPIEVNKGDIIFFRPHGFFELPDHEGTVRYVVRMSQDIILGKYVARE